MEKQLLYLYTEVMENCIFCKIAQGLIPSEKVYEDEETFAFLDIKPNNVGHTLVIPKDHFENIYTIPDETFARMALTAKKIAIAVKHATDCDGINMSMNNEEAGGQLIFHAHLHIIPRFRSDNFPHFPQKEYNQQESGPIAEKIREELK